MEDCDEFICGTAFTKNSLARSKSRDQVRSQVLVHSGADELDLIASGSEICCVTVICGSCVVAFAVAVKIKENAVALFESGREVDEFARDL
jgi:hypothetical protein